MVTCELVFNGCPLYSLTAREIASLYDAVRLYREAHPELFMPLSDLSNKLAGNFVLLDMENIAARQEPNNADEMED